MKRVERRDEVLLALFQRPLRLGQNVYPYVAGDLLELQPFAKINRVNPQDINMDRIRRQLGNARVNLPEWRAFLATHMGRWRSCPSDLAEVMSVYLSHLEDRTAVVGRALQRLGTVLDTPRVQSAPLVQAVEVAREELKFMHGLLNSYVELTNFIGELGEHRLGLEDMAIAMVKRCKIYMPQSYANLFTLVSDVSCFFSVVHSYSSFTRLRSPVLLRTSLWAPGSYAVHHRLYED